MTDWLPGAIVVPATQDGGSMLGGGAFCTWHSFEADPHKLGARRGAEVLVAAGNGGTFCVNPLSGEIAQMVPASRASRMLRNVSGGVQTNRAGDVHIQIEVIAFANNPFTNYWTIEGKAAIQRISAFARAHGVPDIWPAGQPPAYPGPGTTRTAPNSGSGHYSHSQWMENDHGDPGLINGMAMIGQEVLPPPISPPSGTYTVRSGDTLSGIGFRLGISWQTLANLNGLVSPYTIYPGQVLKTSGSIVPPPIPESSLDLRLGDKGERVRVLQDGLNRVFPAYSKLVEDASFGPKTEKALKTFQYNSGLKVDGVMGPITRRELAKYGIRP